MSRFHINNEGNVRKCTATAGRCPYGDTPHYSSKGAAMLAYENLQKSTTSINSKKNMGARKAKSSKWTSKFDKGETSAEAYYGLLLAEADATMKDGNYAISAALIARKNGKELVSLGHNEMFSNHDPSSHAEMNSIKRLASGINDKDASQWISRNAKNQKDGLVLYASLEPCPMCTENAINAGVTKIIIANEDEWTGSMAPERFVNLPRGWQEIAKDRNLQIEFTQNKNPSNKETYLPKYLQQKLVSIFNDNRDRIDLTFRERGLFSASDAFSTIKK